MRRAIGLAIAVLFVVSACAGESEVGAGIDLEGLDDETARLGGFDFDIDESEAGGFIGEQEREEEQRRQEQEEEVLREREQQQQELEQAAALSVNITSRGFDPYFLRIFVGGSVSFTNQDDVDRSVVSDTGEFDSGPISRGETWTYRTEFADRFNFHDGTRPFVVGTLEVLDR